MKFLATNDRKVLDHIMRNIIILGLCLNLVGCLTIPNSINRYPHFDRITRLYEKEASFNDDVKIPMIFYNGINIQGSGRYVKDPLYEPKGGDFRYRFDELRKLLEPTRQYALKSISAKKFDQFLNFDVNSYFTNAIENYMENDEAFIKAKKETLKASKKYEIKDINDIVAKKMAKDFINTMKEKANTIHSQRFVTDSHSDNGLTKKWNLILHDIINTSKESILVKNILHYRDKIYLLHKLAINDVLIFSVKNNNSSFIVKRIDFQNFFQLLNANDKDRFYSNYSVETSNNLAELIEIDVNKKLSEIDNWDFLIKKILKPSKLSEFNLKIIDKRHIPKDTLIILNEIINVYVKTKKNAYILSNSDRAPFTSNKYGTLYISKGFYNKIKNDEELLKSILLHEAMHIKFDLLKLNPHKSSTIQSNQSGKEEVSKVLGLAGRLGKVSEKEISGKINKIAQMFNKITKIQIKMLNKIDEFIVDQEVFNKITNADSIKFISFMKSRHVGYNRYKTPFYRDMDTCNTSTKFINRTYMNFNELYNSFIESKPKATERDNKTCKKVNEHLNKIMADEMTALEKLNND